MWDFGEEGGESLKKGKAGKILYNIIHIKIQVQRFLMNFFKRSFHLLRQINKARPLPPQAIKVMNTESRKFSISNSVLPLGGKKANQKPKLMF